MSQYQARAATRGSKWVPEIVVHPSASSYTKLPCIISLHVSCNTEWDAVELAQKAITNLTNLANNPNKSQ